jgi:hypothetical protein
MDDSFAILRLVTLAPKRHVAMTEPDYVMLKTGLETMVGKSAGAPVKKALNMMFHSTARVKVTFEQYLGMVGMVFEAGEDDDKIETSAGDILAQGVSAVGQMNQAVRRSGVRMLNLAVNGPSRTFDRLRSTVFVNGQNMVFAIMVLFALRFFLYTIFQYNTVEGIDVGRLNVEYVMQPTDFLSSISTAFNNVFFSDVSVFGAGRRMWNGFGLMQRYQSFIDDLVAQTADSGFLNNNPAFDPLRNWISGMSNEQASQNIARALSVMNRRGKGTTEDTNWFKGLDQHIKDALNTLGNSKVGGEKNPYFDLFNSMRLSEDRGLPEAVLAQNSAFSSSVFYTRMILALTRLYGRAQGWDRFALDEIKNRATDLVRNWLGDSAGGPMLSLMVSQFFSNQSEGVASVTARYDSMLALSSIAAVYGVSQFCMNTYRTFTNPRGVFDRSNAVNWYQTVVNSSMALSQVLNLGVLASVGPETAVTIMSPEMIQGQIQAQAFSFILEEMAMAWGGYRRSFWNSNTAAAFLTFSVAQLYGAGNFVAGTSLLTFGAGSFATIAYRNMLEVAGQPMEELASVTPENLIANVMKEEQLQIEPPPERTKRKRPPARSRSPPAVRRTPRRRYVPTEGEMLLRRTLAGKAPTSSRVRANDNIIICAKANAIVQTHINSLEELDMKEEARLFREAKKLGTKAVYEYYQKRAKEIFKDAEATPEEVDLFIEFVKRMNEEDLLSRLEDLPQNDEVRFFDNADWTALDPDEFEKQLDDEYARLIEHLKEQNGGELDKQQLGELNEQFSNERDKLLDEYLEDNKNEEWDVDYPVLEEWAEMVRYKSPYSDYLKSKARERRLARAKERENEFKNFDEMMQQWDRDTEELKRMTQKA